MSHEYDVAVIGAGLGGLVCANILSGAGLKVVVLEKNKQLGGSLQVFSRDKRIFDTGVHYVGALDEGQILDRYFRFLKIRDKLDLMRMDEDGFDRIHFDNEDHMYPYAQGMNHFAETLIEQFPGEKDAILKYCAAMQDMCDRFPLYTLDKLDATYDIDETFSVSAAGFIESLTNNRRLQQVLAGTNMLYAGVRDSSPFYLHSLIVNSYVQSAWKPVNGGSQIPTALAMVIREHGGEIRKRARVEKLDFTREGVTIQVKDQDPVVAKKVISNIHPIATIDLVGEEYFRKSFVNRLQRLENTISSFSAYLSLKENSVPYLNYNIYHSDSDVWDGVRYTPDNWPNALFVSCGVNRKHLPYTDALSVLCYMHYDEVRQWEGTYNTIAEQGERGQSYEDFKEMKVGQIMKKLELVMPGISDQVVNAYAATPLTYRDYIGSPDGGMYGFAKDHRSFLKTSVYPRTSIPNLYLTGQNLSSHGVLGVTVGAVTSCFEFLGRDELLKKIIQS